MNPDRSNASADGLPTLAACKTATQAVAEEHVALDRKLRSEMFPDGTDSGLRDPMAAAGLARQYLLALARRGLISPER